MRKILITKNAKSVEIGYSRCSAYSRYSLLAPRFFQQNLTARNTVIAKNELGFHHRGHGAHRVRISINAVVGFTEVNEVTAIDACLHAICALNRVQARSYE